MHLRGDMVEVFICTPKMGGSWRMSQRVGMYWEKKLKVYPEICSSSDFPRAVARKLKVKDKALYASASTETRRGYIAHCKAVLKHVIPIVERVRAVRFPLVMGGTAFAPNLVKKMFPKSEVVAVTIKDDKKYASYLKKSTYQNYATSVKPKEDKIISVKNYMIELAKKSKIPVYDVNSDKFPMSEKILNDIAQKIVRGL